MVHTLGIRVISGDYPPGSLIEPGSLGDELGVSKAIVRDALNVLSGKGLVGSGQERGTIARERTAWHQLDTDVVSWRCEAEPAHDGFLADLAEVRGVVEPAGARLAAHRRTEDDLRDIGEALAAMAAAGRHTDRVAAADVRFHALLPLKSLKSLKREEWREADQPERGDRARRLPHRYGPGSDRVLLGHPCRGAR